MSTLYMVATPIGNLEDITLRALRILREVDVIACEDTRHTQLLLSHYEIQKRLIACHSYNEEESAKGIIALLDEGKNVAYCSDAGTPGISDPGSRLCERVRTESDHAVVPLPGASAFVSLISAAGRIGKAFTFEGFLSPKKGRRTKRLETLVSRGDTFIIYESPFRVLRTMEELKSFPGIKRLVVGRELTKAHEEISVGTPEEIYASYSSRQSIKGEFVILCVMGEDDDNDKEDQDA
jgi:16S rRNA (cytidine1402-2'-O)-methyltransferase